MRLDGLNRQIAQKLFVELPTIKWHISNIYKKLGVRSRVQAIVRSRERARSIAWRQVTDPKIVTPGSYRLSSCLTARPSLAGSAAVFLALLNVVIMWSLMLIF